MTPTPCILIMCVYQEAGPVSVFVRASHLMRARASAVFSRSPLAASHHTKYPNLLILSRAAICFVVLQTSCTQLGGPSLGSYFFSERASLLVKEMLIDGSFPKRGSRSRKVPRRRAKTSCSNFLFLRDASAAFHAFTLLFSLFRCAALLGSKLLRLYDRRRTIQT